MEAKECDYPLHKIWTVMHESNVKQWDDQSQTCALQNFTLEGQMPYFKFS